MTVVRVLAAAGDFAEDKDAARELREHQIGPALDRGDEVVVDFTGVALATQSFIHALISDLIRRTGPDVLDQIEFRGCNDRIKTLIGIVVEYMQDSLVPDEQDAGT